jgi:hypothetical protein
VVGGARRDHRPAAGQRLAQRVRQAFACRRVHQRVAVGVQRRHVLAQPEPAPARGDPLRVEQRRDARDDVVRRSRVEHLAGPVHRRRRSAAAREHPERARQRLDVLDRDDGADAEQAQRSGARAARRARSKLLGVDTVPDRRDAAGEPRELAQQARSLVVGVGRDVRREAVRDALQPRVEREPVGAEGAALGDDDGRPAGKLRGDHGEGGGRGQECDGDVVTAAAHVARQRAHHAGIELAALREVEQGDAGLGDQPAMVIEVREVLEQVDRVPAALQAGGEVRHLALRSAPAQVVDHQQHAHRAASLAKRRPEFMCRRHA